MSAFEFPGVAPLAEDVAVTDAGGLFAGTDAEAVLAELHAKAPGRELAYAQTTSTTNITATTEAGGDVVVTAPAVVLDGSTEIIVEYFTTDLASPGGGTNRQTLLSFFDAVDGGAAASIGIVAQSFISVSAQIQHPAAGKRKLTPAAGSHVYSLRGFVNAGTGAVVAGGGGAGNHMPCFIRVTRA